MSPPSEKCAICGRPPEAKFSPFCSKRCADIDLGRWLKGSYAIPGPPLEETPDTPRHSPANANEPPESE